MTTEAKHTATDVLRVPEVAQKLRCSDDAVYQLVASGRLRSVRVGRLVRVPASALAAFIAGQD
ncbi:helix-turn-helix domain-containing protein [Micropruina sp.]|uniref:helix-turn-helix domain-containing protein n=1 Tax=Micropruina sp. TaxID=2737536 RepID=UPI0039E4460A